MNGSWEITRRQQTKTRLETIMKNLTIPLRSETNWGKSACSLLFLFVTTAIALPAQTFTTLANFPQSHGANPRLMSLVQGADGNFTEPLVTLAA